MIYWWDKKLKKMHILEADIIKKNHWFDVSCSKDTFFVSDLKILYDNYH